MLTAINEATFLLNVFKLTNNTIIVSTLQQHEGAAATKRRKPIQD